jgi:hypothetical protein
VFGRVEEGKRGLCVSGVVVDGGGRAARGNGGVGGCACRGKAPNARLSLSLCLTCNDAVPIKASSQAAVVSARSTAKTMRQ